MSIMPIRTETVDLINVRIYENRKALGLAAGIDVIDRLRKLLNNKERVGIILGSAPSQNELMDALGNEKDIDWSRVIVFHMDEYIGLQDNAPQKFSRYLRERLLDKVKPGKFYIIDGCSDPIVECKRYSQLLQENPVDIVCLGIGENGHIAFNDPPVADFNDPFRVKVVQIDTVCRQQQVNDGCFQNLHDVPTHAITLTVPTLMSGTYLYCIVPGPSKAKAVRRTLTGEITPNCPATILRKHPCCTLYLDPDSYGEE